MYTHGMNQLPSREMTETICKEIFNLEQKQKELFLGGDHFSLMR